MISESLSDARGSPELPGLTIGSLQHYSVNGCVYVVFFLPSWLVEGSLPYPGVILFVGASDKLPLFSYRPSPQAVLRVTSVGLVTLYVASSPCRVLHVYHVSLWNQALCACPLHSGIDPHTLSLCIHIRGVS